EDGIRDKLVTGVQTCALPILFGGYLRHLWGQRLSTSIRWVPKTLRRAAAAALLSLAPETWDALYRPLAPLLPHSLKQRSPGYNEIGRASCREIWKHDGDRTIV